jgi:hypothetical protein
MLKTLQFKQYNSSILTNVLTSQFIYSNPNRIACLKKLSISIQIKGSKATHFWYLTLLTNQKPYIKKYHLSWKSRAQKKKLIKPYAKTTFWTVNIKKNFFLHFIRGILFDLFSTQRNFEKRILRVDANAISITIPSAPLTSKTWTLQSRNGYLINIPLTLRFIWKDISLCQKIFLLRNWKIVNQPNIKSLDEKWIA